ncbi:hypothetical protein TCEA9_22460 [Thermobrachium celere]|nr:hypothetical protein TCEA9_22460 [Thermobrachium celere]
MLLGLIFAVIYYFVFLFIIKKYDLPTPGRMEEESTKLSGLGNQELKEKASLILEALEEKTM